MSQRRNESVSETSANGQSVAANARQSAVFRARRLQAIVDVTPWAATANIINASVSFYFLIDIWPRWIVLSWFCAVAAVGCFGLPLWRRTRRQPLMTVSSRTVHKVIAHGVVLAGLWAVVPAKGFVDSNSAAQLFIVGLTTGMLCAGGLATSCNRVRCRRS